MRQAYEEGRGGVLVRAKMHIEDGSGTTEGGKKRARRASGGGSPAKPLVVITELPYQTNKVGAPFRHCLRFFPGAFRLPYALRGCWRGCVPACLGSMRKRRSLCHTGSRMCMLSIGR